MSDGGIEREMDRLTWAFSAVMPAQKRAKLKSKALDYHSICISEYRCHGPEPWPYGMVQDHDIRTCTSVIQKAPKVKPLLLSTKGVDSDGL